ncbi:MAG: hypothetical protein JSV86_21590 [Gemmatimonadota bacterium]|nr:MAG: hypothetical protein JSV86_21590 [Gemmatimonadota bacterium]
MAIATTTIQGTVHLPSGAAATGGYIRATLSAPGYATDNSGVDSPIAGSYNGTIGADGSITLAVVPNDVITPATTYYTFEFVVTSPESLRWSIDRTVDTSPDPADMADLGTV